MRVAPQPASPHGGERDIVAGVDVGGTSIKAGWIDRRGRLRGARKVPTFPERGPDKVVERILDVAARMARGPTGDDHRARDGDRVAAIGVVVPGVVDEQGGMAVRSVNLGWRDLPLRGLLEEATLLPTALAHDVRAGSLAESVLGAAAGARDFLFVALGAGVGAAVVIRGTAYAGANQRGGEFGHMSVAANGPRCRCGARGCIEAFASGSSIARRYLRLTRLSGPIDASEVVRRAFRGDTVARRVWAEATDALAMGIANYATLLDPERAVIGGGVAQAGSRLFGPLREALAEHMPRFQTAPPIVPAALRSHSGCVGAGLLAWELAGSR